MCACIFLFGLFYSIVENFQSMVKEAEEGVAVSVFFNEGISQEQIDEIKKSIWRVERIIKATLLFTKGVAIKKSDFELKQLEEEMRGAIGHYSYSKDIEFDLNLPNISIQGDFELISMVIQNMIFNAIDAIEDTKEDTGVIRLYLDEDDGFFYLAVEDSGVPIADKSMLFDPFKTTKTKWNGLGLALSLQIANAHGGKIEYALEKGGPG